jgi:hypothetical protein
MRPDPLILAYLPHHNAQVNVFPPKATNDGQICRLSPFSWPGAKKREHGGGGRPVLMSDS